MTRLYDPARNRHADEKARRAKQNEFRAEACRVIKVNFKNSIVGLYPDEFSSVYAPDVLLSKEQTNSKTYFDFLISSQIALADDGLKDTAGWKIGEYVVFNKPIISTPINVDIPDFRVGEHYLSLNHRNDVDGLCGHIDKLLTNDKLRNEMMENNMAYCDQHLEPYVYFKKIIEEIESSTSKTSAVFQSGSRV
jgi:glycosyltransferase involved in cell wall biosynthesis